MHPYTYTLHVDGVARGETTREPLQALLSVHTALHEEHDVVSIAVEYEPVERPPAPRQGGGPAALLEVMADLAEWNEGVTFDLHVTAQTDEATATLTLRQPWTDETVMARGEATTPRLAVHDALRALAPKMLDLYEHEQHALLFGDSPAVSGGGSPDATR